MVLILSSHGNIYYPGRLRPSVCLQNTRTETIDNVRVYFASLQSPGTTHVIGSIGQLGPGARRCFIPDFDPPTGIIEIYAEGSVRGVPIRSNAVAFYRPYGIKKEYRMPPGLYRYIYFQGLDRFYSVIMGDTIPIFYDHLLTVVENVDLKLSTIYAGREPDSISFGERISAISYDIAFRDEQTMIEFIETLAEPYLSTIVDKSRLQNSERFYLALSLANFVIQLTGFTSLAPASFEYPTQRAEKKITVTQVIAPGVTAAVIPAVIAGALVVAGIGTVYYLWRRIDEVEARVEAQATNLKEYLDKQVELNSRLTNDVINKLIDHINDGALNMPKAEFKREMEKITEAYRRESKMNLERAFSVTTTDTRVAGNGLSLFDKIKYAGIGAGAIMAFEYIRSRRG